MIVGQVVDGNSERIVVRKSSRAALELGSLIACDDEDGTTIYQVYNLMHGTQLSRQGIEFMAGMMSEGEGFEIFERSMRNYILAEAKPLIRSDNRIPKRLPELLSNVREVENTDFSFMQDNSLFLGYLRDGSRTIERRVCLDGNEALTHHMLISATTGRGKSNLVKVMLWELLEKEYCGILVLDAHDEYYGRNGPGLKDKAAGRLSYYSIAPVRGSLSLVFNLSLIKPSHLESIAEFSQAQQEAMYTVHSLYKERWLGWLMDFDESRLDREERQRGMTHGIRIETLLVLQRRLNLILDPRIFSREIGSSTLKDICSSLEDGRKVIVDTSEISSQQELLIGNMIAEEMLHRYRHYKMEGTLERRPVVAFIVEEAPRVLSQATGIFPTIAREGRKFRIGLIAITQMCSLIPKEILANMNTKVIMGTEMNSEREAVISSAPQDLSKDGRTIASLDRGEAIVSSIFSKFAVPVNVPLFEDLAKNDESKKGGQRIKLIG